VNLYDSLLPPIHREGYPFLIAGVIASLIGFALWDPLGWIAVIVTLAIAYFFRDPPRVTPTRPGLVVAPADGLVAVIDQAVPPEELEMGEEPRSRIVTFLHINDVHINRVPIAATVVRSVHRAGAFAIALPGKSDDNERQSLRLRLASGKELAVVQIAGKAARRIVTWVKDGDSVVTGQRFGLIRFGSRVDLYLDPKMRPLVVVGQRMVGGETVVADEKSREAARVGEVR